MLVRWRAAAHSSCEDHTKDNTKEKTRHGALERGEGKAAGTRKLKCLLYWNSWTRIQDSMVFSTRKQPYHVGLVDSHPKAGRRVHWGLVPLSPIW